MPSGKRHLQLELTLLPFLIGVYLVFDASWLNATVFGTAYLAASLWLSPDLDLRRNAARRRWGVLGFIWIPYSKLFKHRGLSHHPFFGLLTRVGYLFALIYGFSAGLSAIAQFNGSRTFSISWEPNGTALWVAAMGLYLPNPLHVLLDRYATRRKLGRTRQPKAHARRSR